MANHRQNPFIRRLPAHGRCHVLLIAALLPVMAASCEMVQPKPVHLNIEARRYSSDASTPVKRVLVMPFYNETEYKDQGVLVGDTFSQILAERGCFEVVPLPREDEEMVELLQPYITGRVPMEVLMELGSWYRADAVLLGCLKRYDPYTRPKIGLKADLVSVYNGSVLRTVHGLLDAGEDNVARDLVNYFEQHHRHSHDQSLSEWRGLMASPRMYARYACHRFIEALYPVMN